MKKKRKITDIQINKKNIKRRIIYLDNELFIETDDTIVNDLDLYIGKNLTETLIDTIRHEESFLKAKKDSIRFLSYRPRSQWEIENKLKNKKYNTDIIHNTIDWLKDKKLIDDKIFSQMWIKDRINKKPLGKLRLRKELYTKGIDREIIENAINDFFDKEIDELELAYQMIQKKKKSLMLKNIQLEPQKIVSLLRNRGFSYQVVHHIYNELFTEKHT